MFCDRKLQALTGFCATDRTRMALLNVRFEGETAYACNGHVLAITTLRQDMEPGVDSPVQSSKTPFSVSAESITKAFKNLPKKSSLPHTQGVFVAENVAASFSDVKNCAEYREEVDQNYPNVKQAIPKKTQDDTVLAISKENLGVLYATMKSCGYHVVTLRIPIMTDNGCVCEAVSFSMGDSTDGITGVVMPYTSSKEESNTEHIPVSQVEIAEMLDLLCCYAPEDERVQFFAEKYKKLVITESLAA
jgi:hypothetical protein